MLAPFLAVLLVLIGMATGLALVAARRRIVDLEQRVAEFDLQAKILADQAEATQSKLARQLAALEAAPLGVVIADVAGTTVHSNNIATGYSAADAAVIRLRLRNLIVQSLTSPESIENELELFSPTARTMLLRAVPLFDDDNRIGTAGFVEDLTTRSRIDSIRRDFIENASHELKTPLGALRLLAEALIATNDDAVRASLGERFQGEAERMTRLVEDILDLALIEDDQQADGLVDLCDVVMDAVEQTRLLSETLDIPIRRDCVPVTVVGDSRQLVSALANLVENAIAYTKAKGEDSAGAVEIRVFPSGPIATIEVEDHGIGIPERHQDRIFERFYRVERGRSRASGGTGLGLAIVSHVVQNHGGQIHVESVPGTGSTFRIELPQQGQ